MLLEDRVVNDFGGRVEEGGEIGTGEGKGQDESAILDERRNQRNPLDVGETQGVVRAGRCFDILQSVGSRLVLT